MVLCDGACGARYYRSQLTLKRNGLLLCPAEASERTAEELSELQATDLANAETRRQRPMNGGGSFDPGTT